MILEETHGGRGCHRKGRGCVREGRVLVAEGRGCGIEGLFALEKVVVALTKGGVAWARSKVLPEKRGGGCLALTSHLRHFRRHRLPARRQVEIRNLCERVTGYG